MTPQVDFRQDIYDLNLQYLIVLQRVVQADAAEAVMRFGIDAKTAAAVRHASIRDLQMIASSVVAMMAPRDLLADLALRDPSERADRTDRARAGAILRSIPAQ